MTEKIERLVDGLAGREFVGDVCRLLDEHLGRGDTRYLADVAAALHARYGSGEEGAEHRYLFDRILWDLVTTPGRENVAHAVRLGLADGPRTGRSVRRAAAVLAAHQSTADLAVLYAPGRAHDDAPDELRACLVQESALRGAPIAELPEAVAWAESSPSWAGHPLALLPWSLMPLEGEPRLPRYSRGGAAYGVRYGLPDGRPLPVGHAAPAPAPAVHRGPDEPALTAAVERWAGRSYGRVESAVFLLGEPLTGRPAVHPLLAALPLDCLVDVPAAPDRLTVVPGSAAEAWSRLFGAASLGGGRSDGWWYGAYGRLAAWRSLTALVGAPEGTPVPEVAERARGCDWYAFEASGDWFNQDGMDFALLTVTRDRRRLAVLAATDYDGG
ncbi:DUF6183 family protein [Kitasatospora sp. NPDC059599]|uniref:DUF6183 family protein n=1 Tax=Kitasatospora sp. NPDC059599 TaxID=3346880 RepID=UPI0036A9A563